MITNYIIKRVNVYEGYKLNIELNLNVQLFLNGIDSIRFTAILLKKKNRFFTYLLKETSLGKGI